jgi:hypothetical protein
MANPTYIQHFWQGNHHIYGHKQCKCTVLANPAYELLHFENGNGQTLRKRRNYAGNEKLLPQ